MTDIFSDYERGLTELLHQLGKSHPRYTEALSFQSRLQENINRVRRHGDTETRRAERSEIIENLNRLSLETTGESFESYVTGLKKKDVREISATNRPVMINLLIGLAGIIVAVLCMIILLSVAQPLLKPQMPVSTSLLPSTSLTQPAATISASAAYLDPLSWIYPIATASIYSPCEESTDWAMVNGSPSNNAYSEDFLALPLHLAWEWIGARGMSRPIVVGEVVYVVNGNGEIWALRVSSGEAIWEMQVASLEGESVGLAYYSDKLYLASYNGVVYALDSADGRVIWTYDTGSTINSSPIVSMNTIYIGTWDGELLALDAETGNLRWAFGTEQEIFSSDVAAGDNKIFVFFRDGDLFALDLSSGEEVWRINIGGRGNGQTPVLYQDRLYISSSTDVLAIDQNSGDVLWTRPLRGVFLTNSVSVDEYLVYVSVPEEYEIVALDSRNGNIRWRQELLGRPASTAPLVTSRYLFTRMNLGDIDALIALDKFRGTILWQENLEYASNMASFPGVILTERTLLTNAGNTLVAYESHSGALLMTGNNLSLWNPFEAQLSELDTNVWFADCISAVNEEHLVCIGMEQIRWDLYTVDWASEEITKVTDIAGRGCATLEISPLGDQVAYAYGTGSEADCYISYGDLYLVDTENYSETRITDRFCGKPGAINWSPEGDWLIFPLCADEESSDLFTDITIARVNTSSRTMTSLSESENSFDGLTYDPNGLWITYSNDDEIILENPISRVIPLQVPGHSLYQISWSPSGQLIASEPWYEDHTGIYISNLDGSYGRWIVEYDGNIFPDHNPYDWSPDGRYIAYLRRVGNVYIVDIIDICTSDVIASLELEQPISSIRWIP